MSNRSAVMDNERIDYDDQILSIKRTIDETLRLREGPTPGTANHQRFQERIDNLTDLLIAWEDALPKLDQLDRDIARKDVEISTAERQDDPWFSVAIGAGLVCAVSLLAGLALNTNWMVWLFFAVTGVGTVGAAFLSLEARRGTQDDLDELRQRRNELVAQRAGLLPKA